MSGLPAGWGKCQLNECLDILDKQRVPINNKERGNRVAGKSSNQLYPYYGATGQVGYIDDYIFDEELVALGEDGVPFFDTFKNKAYILKGKTWVNNHAHVLKGLGGIPNKYICYYFNQFDYHGYVNGATRLKLTQANMKKMPVLLAPLNEQIRIANKLDSLLGKLQATQKRLDKIPTLLKRYRQSVLAAAVSGELTLEWRGIVKPLTVSIDNLDIESDPFDAWKESTSLGIPDEWIYCKISQLGEMKGGGTPRKNRDDYWEGKIPWVTPKDMKVDLIEKSKLSITEVGLNESSARLIEKDSILFVVRGMILAHSFPVAINVCDVTVNQDMKCLTPFEFARPKYLLYALQSLKNIFVGLTTSANHGTKRLEAKIYNNVGVPIPPINEQEEIIRRIEKMFSLADQAEQHYQAAKQRTDKLTQSILAKAFRGELVPQDPNDEPASELLKRIQVEKDK